MEIINLNKPSMPEQVQANTENIKLLADRIQDVYVANVELNNNATTINSLNIKNWNTQATTGFILDTTGKLFKIVAVSDNIIYIEYWSTLVQGPQGPIGPQGPQGPIGPQGPRGNDGAGVADITRINMQVGEPNVIYDTEDGITVLAQGNIQTSTGSTSNPETEMNIPLIAGDGLTMDATEDGKHVDIHLSAETQQTLARTLKTPMSIPTEDEVVGIGTNGAQIRIDKKDLIQSNPNLLINGDFRVNQRNWTTGNSVGYTVDRWKNVNTFGTIAVNTDGTITVSASGGTAYFIQKLEQQDGNRIKGKTVTLSYCDVDGNIYSQSGTISSSGSSEPSLKTEWGYLRLFYNANPNIFEATIHINDGKSITLKWVKLEIGSVATDFNPRPYAEELAMCQRFYQVLGVNNSGFSDFEESQVDGVGYYMVNTPVPLTSILPRTNPTVTVLTLPNIRNYNNLNVLAIDYYSITSQNNNQIILKFYADGVERGVIYHMYNGRISLDAEL